MAALAGLGLTASGLAGLFGADGSDALASRSPVAPADRYLVIIVIDGCRADYASLAPMHHLRALMARGMSYDNAWVGHLESETPTGHATIATGVYPRTHSVIGFGWRDPSTEAFTWLPTELPAIRAGGFTQTIRSGGVPPIADVIHRRNPHDIVVALSGEKYYAAASIGAGADYVFYGDNDAKHVFRPISIGPNPPPAATHVASIGGEDSFDLQDLFAADLAVRLVRTLRPRALLVNLPDVDIAGHYYGGIIDPRDMAIAMRGADGAIGRILAEYKRLGLLDKTVFVVTADHGMAANRHIVPIHPIYRTVAQTASGSLDEDLRSTMGSIWLTAPQQDRSVASALVAQRFPGVEGAFYKVASGSGWQFDPDPVTQHTLGPDLLTAYLNLANTEACPAGPEVVLPYGEDTMGLTFKKLKHWGTHGGFSWGVQHIPLVLAGPGIRHGRSQFPAKLVDIAPTVEHLLGLQIPSGVDGVVLTDALAGEVHRPHRDQMAVRDSRMSDVRVLRAHSRAQSGRHA